MTPPMPHAFLAGLPVPRHNPNQVREAAERVLDRPEFSPGRKSLGESAADWLYDQFIKLLDAILGAATGGGFWSIVAAGVFLLLVAAVGVLVWRVLRGVTADPARATGTAEPLRPATDWRAEAEAHERAGAWRQALRCRYRALVADLAARGVVDEVPGTTAGEYRAQVRRGAPASAGHFDDATELFERAWYGDAPTGAGESARFRDLAGQALSAAAR
jgi:hypothetical protein